MAREEKDKTEVGITGKKIPKPGSAKKQYELEKKRRMGKHLGKNVGGEKYSSDVNPYFNPRSVREEVLLDYLLDEGFASDEKSAQAIVGAMSEEWKQSIIEDNSTGKTMTVGGQTFRDYNSDGLSDRQKRMKEFGEKRLRDSLKGV